MSVKRITTNERRLNKLLKVVANLEKSVDDFETTKQELKDLNSYYGSKEWFSDLKDYDTGKIKKIKAGVLSEDAVWNLNEDIKELIEKMKKITL
ncbi:MAG: DUF4298 domain-containing protein [Clostridia bacterium]|nr:DUF4298 domain-containing protein [Clostridia bacterium]